MLNPSASHFSFGKTSIRQDLVREGSRAFSCAYVYANLLGNEAGQTTYDGECVVASAGRIVARAERFGFDQVRLTTAVVDLEVNRHNRRSSHSFAPLLDDSGIIEVRDVMPLIPVTVEAPSAALPSLTVEDKTWELSNFMSLALYDYMRKSKMRGFVISTSGGADSSLCCIFVACMIRDALAAGVDFAKICPLVAELPAEDQKDWKKVTNRMLVGLYQSTDCSSPRTKNAAHVVAEEIGFWFADISVQDLYDLMRKKTEEFLGRPLSWENKADDAALQNLQARSRPTVPWTIANILGFLHITTSNRSEAGVGYCTMDGDTSGSLAPLGGLDKHYIIEEYLPWLAKNGFPKSIAAVLSGPPTADLRPQAAKQTDEKDLMPYGLLNIIEYMLSDRKLFPTEAYAEITSNPRAMESIRAEFERKGLLPADGNLNEMVRYAVRRYYTLWPATEWKRVRLATCFHCDDRNLDPRSWCRFPVLSAGFTEDLEDLIAERQCQNAA